MPKYLPALLALFAALASVAASGCGYSVSSRGPEVAAGAPALRIRLGTVMNKVSPPRPGLEFDLTQRLKDEIALDRRFELSGASADTSLSVTLTSFKEPALVRDFDNQQTETALAVACRVVIEERGERRTVEVTARADYARGTREPREDGLERLWRNLANNILDAVADRDWLVQEKNPRGF